MRLLLTLLFLMPPAMAEVVEFDSSELSKETVLPVFDRPKAVLRRNVLLEEKMEFGVNIGLSLVEALYNQAVFGFNGTYYLDEVSGINVTGILYLGGLSEYAGQLGQKPFNHRYQFTPEPTFVVLGNYQYTAYYGKMSVSKQSIMNLHLYGLVGGGLIGFQGGASPTLSAGIGQKFYFSPTLSLRFDLNFLMYQGPNVVSEGIDSLTSKKGPADFPQELKFSSYLTGGIAFLF